MRKALVVVVLLLFVYVVRGLELYCMVMIVRACCGVRVVMGVW